MESHEEKLLAMVQESKMNQAREIMKQKERELKAQQPTSSGLSYFASFFTSAVTNVASTVRQMDSSLSGNGVGASSVTNNANSVSSVSSMSSATPMGPMGPMGQSPSGLGRGMKLGMGKKESLSVGVVDGYER